VLEKVSKRKGQTKDALIAATAETEADFFVTGEKKRLSNNAKKYMKKAQILNVKEFKNNILKMDS
jgi:predicted nucleic acid-binding protein